MDVRLSEEQELLRASAREILARECPMALVREMIGDARGLPEELWKKMAELGWMGLPFPEAYGGAGLGLIDLVVLLEEAGRVLLPGPFLSSVALAGTAIALAGSDAQKRALLAPIAGGRARAALALLEAPERWDAHGVQLEARRVEGGFRLRGTKRFVLDAQLADWLIVAARCEGEPALFSVEARAPGLSIAPTALLDGTRRAALVRCEDVVLPQTPASAAAPRASSGSSTAPRSHSAPRCSAARSGCSS
jgi:alkylation response protein AidB-like acyl-CoA dehydrogenase